MFIPEIQRNLNVCINRSTGKSAFELLYGYKPRFADASLQRITSLAANDENADPEILRQIAAEHIEKAQAKMKNAFDRKVCPGDTLIDGEIVFIRYPPPSGTGEPTKASPKYKGPFVVHHRVAGDIYCLQNLKHEGSDQGLVNVHISQVRSWKCSSDQELDEESGESGEDNDVNDAEIDEVTVD